MFARKFDIRQDHAILDMLDKKMMLTVDGWRLAVDGSGVSLSLTVSLSVRLKLTSVMSKSFH